MDGTIWIFHLSRLGLGCRKYVQNSSYLEQNQVLFCTLLEQKVVDMDKTAFIDVFER
jgi:hypothetical protein